ncbi:hypothetical protein [Gallaecimonas mangrovi]|uniref:hypothetical protein n=1 Tax=Gallaecimonas mangrovi TaxID=2291597 RepID=UPI0012602B5F|nr:hypothetical protein [Gallaecimonas mangrovi]
MKAITARKVYTVMVFALLTLMLTGCAERKQREYYASSETSRLSRQSFNDTGNSDGVVMVEDSLWLLRYPDYHPRHGQVNHTFEDKFLGYDDDIAIGVMKIKIIGRNASAKPIQNNKYWGVPYYKVAIRPFSKAVYQTLRSLPANRYLELSFIHSNEYQPSLRLPYVLPVNRSLNKDGYLETDWIACPRCFGMTLQGQQKDDPARKAQAAKVGVYRTGGEIVRSGSLDDGSSFIKQRDFLVGDAALAWAKATADKFVQQRQQLGSAPKQYQALVKRYFKGAPSTALKKACPNPLEWRLSKYNLPPVSAIGAEIGVMNRRTVSFNHCAEGFFKHYNLKPWQQSLNDYHQQEKNLAKAAAISPKARSPMTAKAEQKRLQNYVAEVNGEFNELAQTYRHLAQQKQQRIEESERKARLQAGYQAATERVLQRFNNDRARIERQQAARSQQLNALTQASKAPAIVPVLSGPEAVAAGYGTNADGSAKVNQYSALVNKPASTGDKKKPHAAYSTTSPKGHSKSMHADTDSSHKDASRADRKAPVKALFLYHAITAKEEIEDVGDTKQNSIFDVSGKVVRTQKFYRNVAHCIINHGKVLVIAWDFAGKKQPPSKLYFDSADKALANWQKKYHYNEKEGQISGSYHRLAMKEFNADCQGIKSHFTTF